MYLRVRLHWTCSRLYVYYADQRDGISLKHNGGGALREQVTRHLCLPPPPTPPLLL